MVQIADIPDLSNLSREELLSLESTLKRLDNIQRFNALSQYKPYAKQIEFHDLGADKRERLLMAANRVGKSFCGAAETAMHLTGRYPDWWLGRRFDRPIKCWATSDTGTTVRDIVQTKLCGPYGVVDLQGTGAIPRECVRWDRDTSLARGITDLYDTILVEHQTNGKVDGRSILTFKSYEQGRKKWQGEAVDVIWCDEEPDEEIYAEALARIAPTVKGRKSGIIYTTFTPLLGPSTVVLRFMQPDRKDDGWKERGMVGMTIDDAEHIDPDQKKILIDGYPEYQREARSKGTPMLGQGQIFTFTEERIRCDPFEPPPSWFYIWGGDFGIQHPFAAVLLGWEKDNDVLYIMKCIRMSDALPLQHVAAMKSCLKGQGNAVPFAWPQDGHQRKEFDGKLEPLAKIYKVHGQKMMDHHATFPDGSNGTEVGVMEMQERFKTGRLKVFSSCPDWFEEYRWYHRKDGLIVKIRDDLMSATRVGIMARRFARQVVWDKWRAAGGSGATIAKGIDFDLFQS